MTDQANYSHFLSNPVAKPPCRMFNAQMYGFFVSGCEQKMQQYVDATLNLLATESTSFNVLGSITHSIDQLVVHWLLGSRHLNHTVLLLYKSLLITNGKLGR
ncbi:MULTISPECIES: hypothetical protein [Pseudoalteromonas]|uniref:hypothetical protein n=1 Tax=Pseudoalteromonas TaxID=53246 RepID=UPI001583B81F|nr:MULTISPECIES: hypothetical protein [Pseudoalteromonas]MDI4650435.1 hypothetical protein [Pseudoalteromonas shioyasakiensis]NUJ36856.1 hypothetical protein [Pseudoalteromonas sp. 0303]